jgi:hypothetical protein
MPKRRKEALRKYYSDAGARTESERQELREELGWKVCKRKGKTLLLKSPAGGEQIVLRQDEGPVKPELRTHRDRVRPLEGEPGLDKPPDEGSGEPPVNLTRQRGGENGA